MAEPAFSPGIFDQAESADQPRRMRALGRIIPWPHQPHPRTGDDGCRSGVTARAEIRMKRFVDHRRVEEERYDAEIVSSDSSIHGVMEALAQAFENVEEFVRQRPAGEPLTMEIRLRV